MIWQKHELKPLEAIARTGFLMSLISYVVFWLSDVIQPGFVSRYFSIHLFLLIGLGFGVLWGKSLVQYTSHPRLQLLASLFCGALLAVLTWSLSADVGVYHFPVSLIAFFIPSALFFLIRD